MAVAVLIEPICPNRPRSAWTGPIPSSLLLLAWCGVLFFHGLPQGELYRNETLRAVIARDMLRGGDWMVPRLHGEPIFTKPPLLYWAIAACSLPFGEVTEWTARLPSALAATATVFLFFWLFRCLLGLRSALVAALSLPMSLFWLERAPSAEIDMLQVMWVTASLALFLRALADSRNGLSLPATAGALLCVAAGTLTKWTAPLFFYAAIIPLLWWRGQLRLLGSWAHVLSVSCAALVVLAWIAAAVWHTSWHQWFDAVSGEALRHLAPGHGRRALPLADMLLHPVTVLAANLPWSLFALWTLRPSFWQAAGERERFLLQALHCWLWPSVLFWSLAAEHSLRHTAPAFPAIAGLAALALLRWAEPSSTACWRSKLRPRTWLIGGVALWLLLKVLFVEVVVMQRAEQRQARSKGTLLALLIPGGQPLFLFRLKDEGLMFYFGRTVLRLASPSQLPATGGPRFCILTADEWNAWAGPPADVVRAMRDAQGDPIVLIRVP